MSHPRMRENAACAARRATRTSGLTLRTERGPAGIAVVTIAGEIDHDSAGDVRRALAAAIRSRPARVDVQLGGVSFCDCAGLRALLWGRERARVVGCALYVRNAGPQVERLFDITGVIGLLTEPPAVDGFLVRPRDETGRAVI